MRRRDFITGLGSAAAWPVVARAQQGSVPLIGFLNGQSPNDYAYYVSAFHKGLNEAGFVEGQNVAIEYRWAEGRYDALPSLANDLVHRRVAVIVATGTTVAVLAAKAATTVIPIVFTTAGDPVKEGLVLSLNRPGENITGATFLANETGSKRLELLREMVPGTTSIGFLINRNNPNSKSATADILNAARALGCEIQILSASNEREIDTAFATFAEKRVGAIIVDSDAFFIARRDQVAESATHHALPTMYSSSEHVKAGGLMGYGASQVEAYRQVGTYTARVLKGEKVADLPVQQATRYELVINLRAAKALGLTIPPSLLARADEVIE